MFANLPGIHKLVDDVLVEGKTFEELLGRLEKVFAKAQEYRVTIRERKVKWGQEIKFGGFMIRS